MKAVLLILAAALAMPAAANKPRWDEVTTESDAAGAVAATWLLRSGSVGRNKEGSPPTVFGVVMHRTAAQADDEGLVYVVRVNADHCNQPRGDVALLTLSGAVVASMVFVQKGRRVGDALASRICNLSRNVP